MSCIDVLFAGTGSALNPRRAQASIVLDIAGSIIALDLGCYAPNNAERSGFKLDEAQAYIITHEHYDHLCSLPMIAFIKTFRSREQTMKIYTTVPGAYIIDGILSYTAKLWGIDYLVRGVNAGESVIVGDAKLRFLRAEHTVEALSVIVEYSGLKVIVSGDTRPTLEYRVNARNADLAVHEATLPSNMTELAIKTGHSTVGEAISQVEDASIAVLYHLTLESEEELLRLGKPKILILDDGGVIKLC
ncbi:MAG: MBL fold metallo-hydrolase [Acidilobaceae archaeon]